MKKTTLFALIACGILLSSFAAVAGEGGSGGTGVRGGSGAYCKGETPKVLDYYLALQTDASAVGTTLKNIAQKCDASDDDCFYSEFLAPLLWDHSSFSTSVFRNLREYGKPKNWPFAQTDILQPPFFYFETPLTKTLRYLKSNYGKKADKMFGILYGPNTVFDDALDYALPADCTSIQLALVRNGTTEEFRKPELTFEGRLLISDVLQSRFLALHEAIYAAAAQDYSINSARSARAVFIQLLTGADPTPAINDLIAYSKNRKAFRARGLFFSEAEEKGILLVAGKGAEPTCPPYVFLGWNGKDRLLAYKFLTRNKGVQLEVGDIGDLGELNTAFDTCRFTRLKL